MRATISADNDDYEYDFMLTDNGLDNANFVEIVIKQKGEDYYETWVVSVKELYDIVSLFEKRRERQEYENPRCW